MLNFISNYTWIILLPAILVWVTRAVIRTSGALHMLQLEGYKSARFFKWLVNHPARMLDIKELIAIAVQHDFHGAKSITKDLSFLCIGENPGSSKVKKAKEQGVEIISKDSFLGIIETGEINAISK